MTVTKIGVVYSKKQKVRRRLIKLDHDNAHDDEFNEHKEYLHKNEAWLDISLELYNSFTNDKQLDEYIASQIGEPKSDRCVVVCKKTKNVLHVIHGDPTIDKHPSGKIIAHKEATIGDNLE